MAEQGNKSSKQSGKQGKIRAQSQEKILFSAQSLHFAQL